MNFTQIEHIGIAIKDLRSATQLYTTLFNALPYREEGVESEGVKVVFFKVGNTKIELLEATNTESTIAKFIDKKGEGIHHIAFEVKDIYAEIERLKLEGFFFINDTPKVGADNKLVVFMHPKSCSGVLVELCMERVS